MSSNLDPAKGNSFHLLIIIDEDYHDIRSFREISRNKSNIFLLLEHPRSAPSLGNNSKVFLIFPTTLLVLILAEEHFCPEIYGSYYSDLLTSLRNKQNPFWGSLLRATYTDSRNHLQVADSLLISLPTEIYFSCVGFREIVSANFCIVLCNKICNFPVHDSPQASFFPVPL